LSSIAVAAVLVQTGRAALPGEESVGVKDPKGRIPVGVDGRQVLYEG